MDVEIDLAALREALGLSQVQLAEMLGRSHAAVSQMDGRSDMTISKLRQVIETMGGELRVSAEFPDRVVPLGIGTQSHV